MRKYIGCCLLACILLAAWGCCTSSECPPTPKEEALKLTLILKDYSNVVIIVLKESIMVDSLNIKTNYLYESNGYYVDLERKLLKDDLRNKTIDNYNYLVYQNGILLDSVKSISCEYEKYTYTCNKCKLTKEKAQESYKAVNIKVVTKNNIIINGNELRYN